MKLGSELNHFNKLNWNGNTTKKCGNYVFRKCLIYFAIDKAKEKVENFCCNSPSLKTNGDDHKI